MFSAALCDLPAGDDVASEWAQRGDVNKLQMDCFYTDPATDRPVIPMGAMAKTATARQQWVRDKQLSITEVIEQ